MGIGPSNPGPERPTGTTLWKFRFCRSRAGPGAPPGSPFTAAAFRRLL